MVVSLEMKLLLTLPAEPGFNTRPSEIQTDDQHVREFGNFLQHNRYNNY